MRRRYKRSLYQERVAYIRSRLPHACIGVDVIVGFPGETDVDFRETNQFLADLDVNYLHVFTYSERANTLAAQMEGLVPMEIRRERNEQLRSLSSSKQRQFYQQFLGTSRSVLLEKSKEQGRLSGFSDNYLKVTIPEQIGLQVNQIVDLEFQRINKEGHIEARLKSEIPSSASS